MLKTAVDVQTEIKQLCVFFSTFKTKMTEELDVLMTNKAYVEVSLSNRVLQNFLDYPNSKTLIVFLCIISV